MIRSFVPLPLLFFALVLGFSQGRAAIQSEGRYGSIEGVVMTREGIPVAGATVYLFQPGGSPITTTNEAGIFKFTGVPIGKHLVLAYKESDGFPNPVWTFYSEVAGSPKFPGADVRENQTVKDVIVRLGPRASRVLVSVIDANTKRVIKDVEVAMSHVGKPKTLLRSGPKLVNGSFRFNLLVPPLVPINLEVSAPGYRKWRYQGGPPKSRDVLQLEPGSDKRITVYLQPVK